MRKSNRHPRVPTAAGPAEAGPDRQAVLEAVDALDAALLAKDASALLDLLEPDFVGVVPDGLVLARGAYVVFHTRPEEGLVSIGPTPGVPPTVRLLGGSIAIVQRRVSVRRVEANQECRAFDVQRIEVLRAEAGRWRLAAGQGTRVAGRMTG